MSFLDRLKLASAPAAPKGELGDSAQTYAGSGTGGQRLMELEYLYELTGSNAYRVYDRMRFSDPKVAGIRKALDLPVVRASCHFESADPEDEQAEQMADFCEDVFFRRMTTPWRSFLQNALLYLDFGFAPFEVIWATDGREVWVQRLAYRPPSSIKDIYVEEGSIAKVEQYKSDGSLVEIPGEKLLWFCNDKEGDNFKGRPILRAMHKPWFAKEKLEILLLILVEKMGGLPVITEPPGGLDKPTRDKLDTGAAELRIMERGFLRLPNGVEFSLEATPANVTQVLESIKYFDLQLSNVAQAQILDLGVTTSGNRALGMTFSDMFTDSIQARCNYFEDVFNGNGGIVSQLIDFNFPNAQDLRPSLRFGEVSSVDIKAMASGFATLVQAGMPMGEEIWEWVREQLGLPEAKEVPQPPAPEPPTTPEPPVPASGPPEEEAPEGATASETLARRSPRGLECYVDLADVALRFDGAKQALAAATKATRDALNKELVKRAVEAAANGKAADFAQSRPPMLDRLAAQVKAVMLDYYKAGRAQVSDELKRQKAGKPVVEQTIDARQQGATTAAEKPKKAHLTPIPDITEYVDQQAQVLSRSIGSASLMEAAKAALQGADAAAAMTAVERVSDMAATQAGASITRLIGQGRADEAKANAAQVASAYYSAILDDRTCEACQAMEDDFGYDTGGSTDLGLAETWTPNSECEGTSDRCRCITVYEYEAGAAQAASEDSGLTKLAEALKAQSERPIEAHVTVAAAEPATVVVNVPAPVVNVAAAEPAVVTLNVPEPKARRRITKFDTDESGRIVGKTETEE